MKQTRSRDYAYWEDVLNALFQKDGKFGTYDSAVDKLFAEHPEVKEFLNEQDRKRFAKGLKNRYSTIHKNEHDPQPTPKHLRQAFLPFGYDVPPMSPCVTGYDGDGQIGMADATLTQHKLHHTEYKKFHDRGFRYRETSEHKWMAFIERVQRDHPEIKSPETMTLSELIKRLRGDDTIPRDEDKDQPPLGL